MTKKFTTVIPILKKKELIGLIHKVYYSQLKTFRKYLAFTKTRAEVRGGGRKPWKQKGTGNARSGSIRSSIWVGGGVTFGPKPKNVKKKINKKERSKAILTCFLLKQKTFKLFSDSDIKILLTISKTKDFLTFFKQFSFKKKKNNLLILEKVSKNLYLAIRNIKKIDINLISSLNLKKLLLADHIFLSKNVFLKVQKDYDNKKN